MKKLTTIAAGLMLLAVTAPASLAQQRDGDRATPPPRGEGQPMEGHRPPPPRGEMGPRDGRPHDGEEMGEEFGEREGKRGYDGRFGRSEPPLREDQTEEALEVLAAFNPEAAKQLEEMVKEDPDKARNLIVKRVPFIARLLQMKKDDPEGFELRAGDYRLDQQARELANKYRELEAADKDLDARDVKRELEKVVEAHFDVRQKMREHILKKMEERLDVMRADLEKRDDDRKDLIEQRVGELVTEGAGKRW